MSPGFTATDFFNKPVPLPFTPSIRSRYNSRRVPASCSDTPDQQSLAGSSDLAPSGENRLIQSYYAT